MNTHATNLLKQLIDGLYNAKPTPELHAHQMLAAELKGAMQALLPNTSELVKKLIYGDIEVVSLETLGDDCPSHEDFQKMDMEQQTRLAAAATVKDFIDKIPAIKTTPQPTPDAGGWVENTGVMPDGDIESVKYRNGSVFNNTNKHLHRWNFANSSELPEVDITHYRPA